MRSPVSQTILKRVNRWKLIGLLALLSFLVFLLLKVENLLGSALLAFVVAYSLGPAVNFFERRGVSRAVATSGVFFASSVVIVLFSLWLFPYLGETLYRLQNDMPRLIEGVGRFINEAETKLRAIAGPLSSFDLRTRVESQLTNWAHGFFTSVPIALKNFVTVMLLGPFLAYFMVKDGRYFMRSLLGMVPNHLFETALSLQHQINFQVGQFVRARILESVIVGMVCAIGLLIISFPYALLLGLIAGVTNMIPYLGPLMGAVPAFVVAAVNGYSSLTIAAVALVYIIAQLIDAGVLIPLMVAKIVDLHPVTVIVVIIAGAQVMGVLGMIISIPVASTLKVTFFTAYRHLIDTRN